jgi:TRAP transporter TAXI family solute receptor
MFTPLPRPRQLTLATAGTGGIFHPLGLALATVVNRHCDGIHLNVLVTSGTAENMALLEDGTADLALAQADLAWAASQGQLAGQRQPLALHALLQTITGYLHVVTLAGSGIATVDDLRGKRVSTGLPGSGSTIKAMRVLEALGIGSQDLDQHLQLEYPEAARALIAGDIDAFAWDAPLPGKAISDLAAATGGAIRLLDTAAAVPAMARRYGPFYFSATIPAGSYQGVHQDVGAAAGKTLLVAPPRLASSVASEITRALLLHARELAQLLPATREITLGSATQGSAVPFHPGALSCFQQLELAPPDLI